MPKFLKWEQSSVELLGKYVSMIRFGSCKLYIICLLHVIYICVIFLQRRVYQFMARFLTTGMRFLLNQKVGVFHLSVCISFSSLSGCVFVSFSNWRVHLSNLYKRSVQLWIMLLWFMWMQCWIQYLWGQKLMSTLGLTILWLLTQWSQPEALTWTSGSESSP